MASSPTTLPSPTRANLEAGDLVEMFDWPEQVNNLGGRCRVRGKVHAISDEAISLWTQELRARPPIPDGGHEPSVGTWGNLRHLPREFLIQTGVERDRDLEAKREAARLRKAKSRGKQVVFTPTSDPEQEKPCKRGHYTDSIRRSRYGVRYCVVCKREATDRSRVEAKLTRKGLSGAVVSVSDEAG